MNLEGTYFWCSNLEEFRRAEEFYVKNRYRWSADGTFHKTAHILNFPIDIGCSEKRLWVNHPKSELETMKRLNFKSWYLKQYFK